MHAINFYPIWLVLRAKAIMPFLLIDGEFLLGILTAARDVLASRPMDNYIDPEQCDAMYNTN